MLNCRKKDRQTDQSLKDLNQSKKGPNIGKRKAYPQ